MKIIIVSKQTKRGLRYYAYHRGIFSFFHVFCFVNSVSVFGYESLSDCVSCSEESLTPDPPSNSKIVSVVDIKI